MLIISNLEHYRTLKYIIGPCIVLSDLEVHYRTTARDWLSDLGWPNVIGPNCSNLLDLCANWLSDSSLSGIIGRFFPRLSDFL